ncbi:MAG: zinc ribbon domain-containing protein [Candidatus Methanomethylophilaceae archaeon]|nr:zinc ribbon domain-containing protein [Candidatus Methanomethylophilaceae archaeon]MBQ8644459.1 zinc ribbon domain-containing protein [Candidatus Methanomethylophilaceae archaeon]
MDEKKFCTKCGNELAPDAKFCPDCGTRIPGRNEEQVQAERAMVREFMDKRLRWCTILMLIYSVPFLFIGIWYNLNAADLAQTLMTDPLYKDVVDMFELTYQEAVDSYEVVGIAYILSAIFGFISAFLCWKKRMFWVATITCLLSLITGVAGFFAIFVGLITLWMIFSSKLAFAEYSEQYEEALESIQ